MTIGPGKVFKNLICSPSNRYNEENTWCIELVAQYKKQ